ncbi:peptidase inhibitor family I36 protein [Streptomyces sp. 35M1]|uniref:peptidase inhibitor family I36 protein n=1 Tax=Streptomyces sp. 35M1 TaxID=3142978 RepID=UPI003990D1D2
MKRNLMGAALIGAALIIGGTGFASAAPPAGCTTSGWVCLYRDDDFKGGQVSLTNSVTGITHLSNYGFNDQADSFYNNHNKDAAWYTDANYNGRRVCMHSLSCPDFCRVRS